LGVVVLINKLLTSDFIRHLKKLKKLMAPENKNIGYLESVIEHMETSSKEQAVKLLGFVVDQNLAIKVVISVCSTIFSIGFTYLKYH
jgi:hypothetical protein